MNNNPSPELQDQIVREAEAYLKQTGSTSLKDAYEAGAANYAHYKEQLEQAKKALERIEYSTKHYAESFPNPLCKHIIEIIEPALSSWKEEGNNIKTDNNEKENRHHEGSTFKGWLDRITKRRSPLLG